MSAETVTEQEEPAVEETIPEEERPSWLPSQFETPETLASSYGRQRERSPKMGQDNKALRDELEAAQADRDFLAGKVSTLERTFSERVLGRIGGAR